MLSKLDLSRSETSVERPAGEYALLKGAIERRCGASGSSAAVTPAASLGTLGLCFTVSGEDGKKRFVKTHLPRPEARDNLRKEIDLSCRVYRDLLETEAYEIEVGPGDTRVCMSTLELRSPQPELEPAGIRSLISHYDEQLSDYSPPGGIQLHGMGEYLTAGRIAHESLSSAGLLDPNDARLVAGNLAGLERELRNIPRAICHGDLGPKNVMIAGSSPVAIDWEDAFLGVPGYDYLYWLTFMANRRHLAHSGLGSTDLGRDTERAILCLVVLLKSYLAFRSGTLASHTLSVEDRIREILSLR